MKDVTLAAIVLFVIIVVIAVFVLGYKILSVGLGPLEVQLQPPTTEVPLVVQETRLASADRPSDQSPEEFIYRYYQLISSRKYSEAWDLLTPDFQGTRTPNGYSEYESAWRRYGRVNVQSVVVEDRTEDAVQLTAQLDYFDIHKLLVVRMWLVQDVFQSQWKIDRTKILSETPN